MKFIGVAWYGNRERSINPTPPGILPVSWRVFEREIESYGNRHRWRRWFGPFFFLFFLPFSTHLVMSQSWPDYYAIWIRIRTVKATACKKLTSVRWIRATIMIGLSANSSVISSLEELYEVLDRSRIIKEF